MAKKVFGIIKNFLRIAGKSHLPFRKKLALARAYSAIVAKRFMEGRVPGVSLYRQRLPGGTLEVPRFGDFFWTFLEVYLDEDYFFPSEKSDPFIINLGANIGVDEVYFKWLYPQCRILSFEALPENAAILKKNIERNRFRDVEVVEAAVGDREKRLTMYGDRRAATVAKGLIQEQVKAHGEYAGKEVEVNVVPLSPFLKEGEEVDLLKVDIEGAEETVITELDRAGKLRYVKYLVVEYHRYSFTENKLSRIVDALERNRFDITFRSDFTCFTRMPRRAYYNFMLYARRRD